MRCTSMLLLVLRAAGLVTATTVFTPSAFTPPSRTLPDGANNPFYPCGLTPSDCPYRCYVLPNPALNSTVDGRSTLLPNCYGQKGAAALLAATDARYACVQCVTPPASEIPRSPSTPQTCQSLEGYFNSTSTAGLRPARCGTPTDPIAACKWTCSSAQVPFNMCDYKNTTGEYRLCERCVLQCSSPVVVLGNATQQPDFSQSEGVCGARGQMPKNNLCPWRCQTGGRDDERSNYAPFLFCSLVDKTDNDAFTNCTACPGLQRP